MRIVLTAAASILLALPAVAQHRPGNLLRRYVSPLEVQHWAVTPKTPPLGQAVVLGFRAAGGPRADERFDASGPPPDELLARSRHFQHSGLAVTFRPSPETVGQGGQ